MNRSELNSCFEAAVLYYIDQQISGRRYRTAPKPYEYGTDENGDYILTYWDIQDITEPSINMLLTYTFSEVINFYDNSYLIPIMLQQVCPPTISSTQASAVVGENIRPLIATIDGKIKVLQDTDNDWRAL